MRRKIAVVLAAGTVALSGLAVAGPALAAVGAATASSAVSTRTDRIKDALTGLVTDKTLTQAQADKVASTLGSAEFEGGHGGPGRGEMGGEHADLSTAATALGMTEADLRAAVQGGKTLAQIAEEKNIAVDKLVTALVAAEKTRIEKSVTDGRLTQAEADERLSDLTPRVTERVNSTRPGRGNHSAQNGASTPTPSATASS